jgi:hypothetical protein
VQQSSTDSTCWYCGADGDANASKIAQFAREQRDPRAGRYYATQKLPIGRCQACKKRHALLSRVANGGGIVVGIALGYGVAVGFPHAEPAMPSAQARALLWIVAFALPIIGGIFAARGTELLFQGVILGRRKAENDYLGQPAVASALADGWKQGLPPAPHR